MAKGPGLYSDIGKKIRDLLYTEYLYDRKFNISWKSPSGEAITWGMDSSRSKTDETILTSRFTARDKNGFTTGFEVGNDKISLSLARDMSMMFGLKHNYNFRLRSDQVELQYMHDCAGLSLCAGLNGNPNVRFSGLIGTNKLALGGDVSLDSYTRRFNWNAGLNSSSADGSANVALTLNNKGDELKASYYNLVDPAYKLAFGAEWSCNISTNVNTYTFGWQQAVGPMTTLSMRLSNHGKCGLAIKHDCSLDSVIPQSSDVLRSPDVGLSLVL